MTPSRGLPLRTMADQRPAPDLRSGSFLVVGVVFTIEPTQTRWHDETLLRRSPALRKEIPMKTVRTGFFVTAIGTLSSLFGVSAAAADIAITNTTMPNPATVGRNLTYGMNVINNGPEVATGVVVTDTLPPGVILVSAVFGFQDRPRTPCTGTVTITCNIGTLGVGPLEGAGVLITVQPQDIGRLSNTSTVTAD